MTFEIETLTKTKLTEVAVLSAKNRNPDDNPGVALSFSMPAPNDTLSMLDGSLLSVMYYKSAASSASHQATMEGMEVSDKPNLTNIGQKLGKLHWNLELTGYTLLIDYGTGNKSNIEIGDCIVSKFVVLCKEGGTIVVDFQIESQDVSEKVFGKLATLKNREVQIKLTAPAVGAIGGDD